MADNQQGNQGGFPKNQSGGQKTHSTTGDGHPPRPGEPGYKGEQAGAGGQGSSGSGGGGSSSGGGQNR